MLVIYLKREELRQTQFHMMLREEKKNNVKAQNVGLRRASEV